MKQLTIEWKHFDKDGKTCDRCGKTGANIQEAVAKLRPLLKTKDIRLVYKEKKLTTKDLDESNTILVDGVPLEQYLPDVDVKYTPCDSCSCMVGHDVACRTVKHNGKVYEDVPKEFIIEAIHQHVAGWL